MVMTKDQESEVKTYILGPKDRCDSCQAEALVWIKGVSGELFFCKHHYNKNAKALETFAYEVIDESDKLIQNKLMGSEN